MRLVSSLVTSLLSKTPLWGRKWSFLEKWGPSLVCLSFEPHPAGLLDPGHAPSLVPGLRSPPH